VFLPLCHAVLRQVLQLAVLRLRSNDFKDLEIVVLRHELAILRRRTHPPVMKWTDRLFLAAGSSGVDAGDPHRDAGDTASLASTRGGKAVDVSAASRAAAAPP
jgi:hypothetical protein